jgi:two-component system OmpR family sensor kinase
MITNKTERIKAFVSPRSLRFQLLSRSLIILAVLLVLIGVLQYFFMQDVVYQNRAESLQSQLLSIPGPAWERFALNSPNDFIGRPLILMPDTTLAFINLKGSLTVLSEGSPNLTPPRLTPTEYRSALVPKGHKINYFVASGGDAEQIVVLKRIDSFDGQMIGVAQLSTPTKPLKELLVRQLITFLILALLALIVGLLTYLPVLKKTLIPLSKMVETAEKIDAGNLDRRFPARQGQSEIDALARSFNGMLERLQASFKAEQETKEQMRRFIADASHELRTPLTSIHGFLEVLLRGAANQPDQLDKALKSMYSESTRLNKLVHDLLLLTRLDRAPRPELTEGFLDLVVKDMEPQLNILAGPRRLVLDISPGLKCKYDSDQIKQVILNLFQNAVQHTDPAYGCIRIALAEKDNGVQLSVEDNGPGISAAHLPHIFDRFYRSDSSRTRKYGGSGLGLAITKSIIDVHGGTIDVISKENEGCIFRVWLPAGNVLLND